MTDRVSIGTIPGPVSVLVGADMIVGSFATAAEVTRVFLSRTDHGAGDTLDVELRNASGGGGDAIAVTFAAGADFGVGTGSISGTEFYLRALDAGGASANLSGHYDIPSEGMSSPVPGPLLATLARLKEFMGITSGANDVQLQNVLVGVSERMQRYIGRAIVSTVVTGEKHDGPNGDSLVLRHWPLIGTATVTEDGTALPAAAIDAEDAASILYRRTDDGVSVSCWSEGRRNVSVDYTAGYATVPEDLVQACLIQTVYVWRMSPMNGPGGGRIGDRGTVLDAGGSAQYLTGPWAPTVLDTLDKWRLPMVA